MNSNKAEAENRAATQAKIAELEDRSAHLKDYTWLLKVGYQLQATLWLGPACRPPSVCSHSSVSADLRGNTWFLRVPSLLRINMWELLLPDLEHGRSSSHNA